MIRRTLLEWRSLPYGDGPDAIPQHLGDRLAAVAAASPLAGRGGDGVLEHGRRALRARGVVGVIVADGCVLEILPKIDTPQAGEDPAAQQGGARRRLVHILAVALDLPIADGDLAQLDWQRETLLEVLIRLFADKLLDAVRQGLPRLYVQHEEDLPALRGRLDVGRQFGARAADASRLCCRYDALTHDIPLNRILKAAVTRLATVSASEDNRRRLRELGFIYADVTLLPLSQLRVETVSFDRTNTRWSSLLTLARLLLAQQFQTTSSGAADGFSLLFDMSAVFEAYVAAVLRRSLREDGVQVVAQGGGLHCLTTATGDGLFRTRPDILLKRDGAVLHVIDTKWKTISATVDDPKRGVSQADVYQMMAYGRLYACSQLTLLYPHHAGLGAVDGEVTAHAITGGLETLRTATLDVGTDAELVSRLSRLALPPTAPPAARPGLGGGVGGGG